MPQPLRVLVVDDSALIRQLLVHILSSDRDIEVETAPDPLVAREKIKRFLPDVMTLDIEMPRMDGLEFLEKVMTLRPMPVVMVSSLTQSGADATMRALEMGAVDIVAKPTADIQHGLDAMRAEIITKVRQAAHAKVRRRVAETAAEALHPPRGYSSTEKVVAIGASTGGVEALLTVLRQMPADSPAIAITQHMPAQFTRGFAKRLNDSCALAVSEAEDGERLLPGHAYLAPGDRHLAVVRSGANYVCRVGGSDRVSGHCPSVDVLFQSAAKTLGQNAIGVILTGMGKDGAEGLLAMRRAGAHTLGQDEATSVVYGMPRVAFELGGVEEQAPLGKIAEQIVALCGSGSRRAIRV